MLRSLNKLKRFAAFCIVAPLTIGWASAQTLSKKPVFTRADSLRGALTPLRTCYDINFYHLDVRFDIDKKYISGNNLFRFTATQDFSKLQFDLFSNLEVEKVLYKGREIPYTREFNAVFVTFPSMVKKGSKDQFTVFYKGNPTVAKNAPWDGGVVFTADSLGHPWVATACQGTGANVWWPNKDHLSDEPDSMLISISVPNGLKDISNGRLRSVRSLADGYMQYNWFVSNPINNYDVAANIGDFVHFDDVLAGEKGKLTLDYWVLPYNLEKARKQFSANVKPMLQSFEHWFGPYPFYEDGYKLIETPHLGMEHQSGIAYGNKYRNGYLGRDLSGTGRGLDWDFIIVHESAHEWFGNNITEKDIADMWIHESFANYSESLFIENRSGKQDATEYIKGLRKIIKNEVPIIGKYDVNNEGSGDMYPKGANMLHAIRTVINNDGKWLSILRGLNQEFYHQTVTTEQIVNYINKRSGMNLTPVFDQYLRYTHIPVLEFKEENGAIFTRWKADVPGFNMPVKVKNSSSVSWTWIRPASVWKKSGLVAGKDGLIADTDDFYITVSKI